MKKTIIFKAMFMSMALASLASCYDMDDMSKNPYELPDNTTGGGEEQPGEEDKTFLSIGPPILTIASNAAVQSSARINGINLAAFLFTYLAKTSSGLAEVLSLPAR